MDTTFWRGAGWALGGLGAVSMMLLGLSGLRRREPIPETFVMTTTVTIPVPAPMPVTMERHVGPDDLVFTFKVGGASYLALAELAMPPQATLRLVDDVGVAVIGEVAEADVPAEHRVWKDRRVVVDGKCQASVTGFAVVARLVGDVAYAATEGTPGAWDVATVLASARPMLAARLDEPCQGTWARDAARPALVTAIEIEDKKLAARARKHFLASEPSRAAQTEWIGAGMQGKWQVTEGALVARVVRHPRTGVTWVSVHGHIAEGCGSPNINVWGLYRLDPGDELVAVALRPLEELHTIDQLLDVDDDGVFELLGHDWLGLDVMLTTHDGKELKRLETPFFGCPC